MRGLIDGFSPISALERPSRAGCAIWASCGVEVFARLDSALAHALTSRQQLALGAIGEALDPHLHEHLAGGADLMTGVKPSTLAS